MSRLLYRLSYPASASARAPMRNRTADLLLTMETLYRLSYRGTPTFVGPAPPRPRRRPKIHNGCHGCESGDRPLTGRTDGGGFGPKVPEVKFFRPCPAVGTT